MPVNDELGKRMKEFYEQIPKTKLVRRIPVIIRIDGKAFHTFTRGFEKPFDEILIRSMQNTMRYLCENIQGCVFGYTQSDEISLVLVDYKTLESGAWFDYEVQKMCSIAASMTTMRFNREFQTLVDQYDTVTRENFRRDRDLQAWNYSGDLRIAYHKSIQKGAMFDARCFNIPKEEVTNCIYWRQLDAIRNSIQMVGQANFSQKQLQNKSCEDIKKMLIDEKNINWDDLLIYQQRGSSCIKDTEDDRWYIDTSMPILKGDGRSYLENLINF